MYYALKLVSHIHVNALYRTTCTAVVYKIKLSVVAL